MNPFVNEMFNSGGFPTFVIGIAILLKYVLTIFFLIWGILAFGKYLENKNER